MKNLLVAVGCISALLAGTPLATNNTTPANTNASKTISFEATDDLKDTDISVREENGKVEISLDGGKTWSTPEEVELKGIDVKVNTQNEISGDQKAVFAKHVNGDTELQNIDVRQTNGKTEISTDGGKTWEPIEDSNIDIQITIEESK